MENFITGILPNMIPMQNIKTFEDGDRLFYELVEYKPTIVESTKYLTEIGEEFYHVYNRLLIRSGTFKEILYPEKFINNGDMMWHNLDWLKHHNFMLIKK